MKEGERERKPREAKKEQRERGEVSPYLTSVEYKLNEMHDDASTDVPHAELLTKHVTHGEGHSWLNEFLDEEEGGGRRGEGKGTIGKPLCLTISSSRIMKLSAFLSSQTPAHPSCSAVVFKESITFSWPREDSSPLLMVA